MLSKTEFHVLILGIDKAGKTVSVLSYMLYYSCTKRSMLLSHLNLIYIFFVDMFELLRLLCDQ